MPDAIFGLRVARPGSCPVQSFVFLEMDTGSMTIGPAGGAGGDEGFLYRASIRRRLFAYSESWRRNIHEIRFEMSQVRTFIVTNTDNRAENIIHEKNNLGIMMKTPAWLFLIAARSTAGLDALM